MAKKSGISLADPKALIKDMYAMGPSIAQKGGQQGVRKAAMKLRKRLRAAAPPNRTGTLRKVIQFKHSRRGAVSWVGIKKLRGESTARNYYATLERGRNGGPPLHPFIARTIENSKDEVFQTMVTEARKALYVEAGKVHARSRTRRGR